MEIRDNFYANQHCKFYWKNKKYVEVAHQRKEGVESTSKGTVKCLDITRTSNREITQQRLV